MTEEEVEATRHKYISALQPLFLPDDPISNDVVKYFASLLRIVGMEDKGWDPYLESRAVLEDLNRILQTDLPALAFPDRALTTWRMGLLMYSHIVEMDAPYEVITNLLRFRLGKGYSPNPFYVFLNAKQKKRFKASGIYPVQKVEIIKALSAEAKLPIAEVFDDFFNVKLRNAISHSDYILSDEEFRCRNGTGAIGAFTMPLEELNQIITKAKVFVSTFFGLEMAAREHWGGLKHRAIPYDLRYKGLIEILADEEDRMCGFKVHWPNNSESVYRRTRDGIDMINCMLDVNRATVEFMVGMYARNPGSFSPLVERDAVAKYTKLEGAGLAPEWPP